GDLRRGGGRKRGQAGRQGTGAADHQAAVAGDASHPLQGGRPLRRNVLLEVRQGDLPRGRRGPQGRGRLLLVHVPDRRRGERVGAPPVNGRGRVGDCLLQPCGRGRGNRSVRRGHRTGDL